MSICESCLAAYEDEGMDLDDEFLVEMIAASLGADIADHFCDEIEDEEADPCDCACKMDAKKRQRRRLRKLHAALIEEVS